MYQNSPGTSRIKLQEKSWQVFWLQRTIRLADTCFVTVHPNSGFLRQSLLHSFLFRPKLKSPISENSSLSWWKLENLKIPFDTGILWKPWCLRTGGRLTSQIHTWAKKHPLLSRREAQTQHIPVPHTHTHTPSKKENLGFFDLNKGGKAQSRQAFGGLSCSNPKNSQHKQTSIQFFFSF